MKKFLQTLMLVVFGIFAFQTANAQMADGSIAPNWTKTDINGDEHTLYDYLDDGYTVILDYSATWCGPCWSYHTAGTLEEVWEMHGPAGMEGVSEDTTDDVMIFMMEGDDDTTQEDLEGTGGNTTGDWITGTYYPIIDDVYDLFLEYECTYYPTIYTICPSRMTTESGQISATDHYTLASGASCAPATEGNDGALYSYNGEVVSCGSVDVYVTLANTGTETLEACTIEASIGGETVSTDWTGSLDTWGTEEVMVGTITYTTAGTLECSITSGDDNAVNDGVSADLYMATSASTQWFLDMTFDCWPEETSWEVKDDMGSTVASGSGYDGMESANETFNVGAVGCYTFNMFDAYGDGMFGSQWTGCDVDGSWTLSSTDMGTIASYDGSYNYEAVQAGANAEVVSVNELAGVDVVWNVFPNPTDDIANVQFSLNNSSEVVVEVYNMLGQRVSTQDLGTLSAGQYFEELDLSGNQAGVYLINLNANGNVSTQRVTLR